MRLTRLWVDAPLMTDNQLQLPTETSHYVTHVLRLRIGAPLIIFNGQGGEYQAVITELQKKNVLLHIGEHVAVERESPLQLTLVQAVSRPEHMDYTIQKSVELGVSSIIPVISERSPPLDKEKMLKRWQHWQKIIISASEQCGRNRLPHLEQIQSFDQWLTQSSNTPGILLDPLATQALPTFEHPQHLSVLIGAEGGLTEQEIMQAKQQGWMGARLGSRILRTETAALAILAICQAQWGDLGHFS